MKNAMKKVDAQSKDMDKTSFHGIDKKWQKIWEDKKIWNTKIELSKPKFYILDMFPYPSGAGLHVWHVMKSGKYNYFNYESSSN